MKGSQLKLRLSSSVQSGDKSLVDSITKVIEKFDFSKFDDLPKFKKHQDQQKEVVKPIIEKLVQDFSHVEPDYKWDREKNVDNSNHRLDKADICIVKEIDSKNSIAERVIIELDKHRADQVAKKFLARMALKTNDRLIYVALCFPGSKYMNISECIKYFSYCAILAEKMPSKAFIGYLVVDRERWTVSVNDSVKNLVGFSEGDDFAKPNVKVFP